MLVTYEDKNGKRLLDKGSADRIEFWAARGFYQGGPPKNQPTKKKAAAKKKAAKKEKGAK